MFLRALFWVLYISDDAFGDAGGAWFYILFWLPHSVIYLTFATLALFLNKVIKRRNWTQKYRLRFLLAYGIFGLVDVVGTFVLSVLAGTSDDASVENSWESGGGAVLFLLLGAVYMCVDLSRDRLADCCEPRVGCGISCTLRRQLGELLPPYCSQRNWATCPSDSCCVAACPCVSVQDSRIPPAQAEQLGV
jgi:hypothetical protein